MRKLLGLFGKTVLTTKREYEATLTALNIFFGAVIGVNMASIESLPQVEYMIVLMMVAALVTAILFVSYSERRMFNIIMLVLVLSSAWYLFEIRPDPPLTLPGKLLPTFVVWSTMAILAEFSSAKHRAETSDSDS